MTFPTQVSFRHVEKKWQQVQAIQDFSLDIPRGELVVLVGSSGCGKSTLLRMLVGLEAVTQGEIRINDKPVSSTGKERGIIFQEPRLFPWMTVIDNIMCGLADEKISQQEKRQRAMAILTEVQLADFAGALPSQLSGGMAQRVAIARGLIGRPQILMLDEPFGALDAKTRETLQQALLDIHQREGTTILLVTHDVEEAVALADRVVVLSPRPGRIQTIIDIPLAHPRQRDDTAFSTLCRQIRERITASSL